MRKSLLEAIIKVYAGDGCFQIIAVTTSNLINRKPRVYACIAETNPWLFNFLQPDRNNITYNHL